MAQAGLHLLGIPNRCREVNLHQQSFHDAEPFRIEWLPANRLASPTIPVGGVVLIAFLPVEVGMHPRTVVTFVPLGRFVGMSPIALGIPP